MTSDATATPAAAPAARRGAIDGFLAALPFLVVGLVLLGIVFWEAATRVSPSIFIDELEWAQLSRAIAATGHAARRGQDAPFKSIYAFLIAPCWWLPTTTAAYTAIKYLNETLMTLAVVPTYLLARTLVGRTAAAVAALGVLCTTAFYYAPFLLPEALAFPWFALTAYVSIRALGGAGRRWTAAAIALSLVGVIVRGELVVAIVGLALAAAWLWVVGPRGQRFRAGWSVSDHVGVAVLLVGVVVLADRVVGGHSHEFSVVTESLQGRMWKLGLESAAALALGLGLLPLMGGLASLWLPERRANPRWRAFAAYLGGAIVAFGAYTAIKAAYLTVTFGTYVEERNLIYLQPLLLVGAVVYFASRRPSLRSALPAVGFTAFLVLYFGYQLGYPYQESPGYGIAAMANRSFRWTQTDIREALVVASLVCAALVLLPFRHRGALLRPVLAAAAVGVAAWMLAAQVTSARGANVAAKQLAAHLPSSEVGDPLNWVDRASGGHDVTYLGQKEPNTPDGIWLIEFWNKTIKNVWTIDGTAPGPGPTTTPQLIKPDGTLSNDPGMDYVLQDNGVQLIGTPVKSYGALTLVHLSAHPWRLRQASYNVTDDGWTTPPLNATSDVMAVGGWASFVPGKGTLAVQISRKGFNGPGAPPAMVLLRVGPVALNEQGAPVVRHALVSRHFTLQNGTERDFTFPGITGPVAVSVAEAPTFRLTDYGGTDPRPLGVHVGFSFTPTR